MIAAIKNFTEVQQRLVEPEDNLALFQYFEKLSAETKSRFGPHQFDRQTVNEICMHPSPGMKRYIAIDPETHTIVAYMLMKDGLVAGDEERYSNRGVRFDKQTTCTFAPSIADDWQGAGLGTVMFKAIEKDVRQEGKKAILLWGGVQATNERAVQYYLKLGFVTVASFWHNGMDNYDMIRKI